MTSPSSSPSQQSGPRESKRRSKCQINSFIAVLQTLMILGGIDRLLRVVYWDLPDEDSTRRRDTPQNPVFLDQFIESHHRESLKKRKPIVFEEEKDREEKGDIPPYNFTNSNVTTSHSVFFNIFLSPESPSTVKEGLEIVLEQLKMLSFSNFTRDTLVFYNTFGAVINQNLCDDDALRCVRMRFSTEGNEEDTLHDAWRYCRVYPDHTITYIHDKGSYHPSPGNNRLRRYTTLAAASKGCTNAVKPGTSTLCALRWDMRPFPHSLGNMWTAPCSYVAKLVDPKKYASRRKEILEELEADTDLMGREFPCLENFLEKQRAIDGYEYIKNLGLERYANENWVASHPDFAAVSVIAKPIQDYSFTKWYEEELLEVAEPFSLKGRKRWVSHAKLGWYQKSGRWYEMAKMYDGQTPAADNPFFSLYDEIISEQPQCPQLSNNR